MVTKLSSQQKTKKGGLMETKHMQNKGFKTLLEIVADNNKNAIYLVKFTELPMGIGLKLSEAAGIVMLHKIMPDEIQKMFESLSLLDIIMLYNFLPPDLKSVCTLVESLQNSQSQVNMPRKVYSH